MWAKTFSTSNPFLSPLASLCPSLTSMSATIEYAHCLNPLGALRSLRSCLCKVTRLYRRPWRSSIRAWMRSRSISVTGWMELIKTPLLRRSFGLGSLLNGGPSMGEWILQEMKMVGRSSCQIIGPLMDWLRLGSWACSHLVVCLHPRVTSLGDLELHTLTGNGRREEVKLQFYGVASFLCFIVIVNDFVFVRDLKVFWS